MSLQFMELGISLFAGKLSYNFVDISRRHRRVCLYRFRLSIAKKKKTTKKGGEKNNTENSDERIKIYKKKFMRLLRSNAKRKTRLMIEVPFGRMLK